MLRKLNRLRRPRLHSHGRGRRLPLVAVATVAGLTTISAAGLATAASTSPRAAASARAAHAVTAQAAHRAMATAAVGCRPPYSPTSPWNTPIASRPAIAPGSAMHVRALGSQLSSDPTEYTYPVYLARSGIPLQAVHVSGTYSNVSANGRRLRISQSTTVRLRIPTGAGASAGSDGQLVLLDPLTGNEWGFWRLQPTGAGRWSAENGYRYNIGWNGVPPRDASGSPFGSRGSGVPYLAGLVRPCELAQGHIDHALALAYPTPTSRHVYPATKSDGGGTSPADMPEGSRLQLDPRLTAGRLRSLGCRGACLTIARAMQVYGMYIIDNSGHAKIMLEDNRTAHWHGRVSASTVSPIPISDLRLLSVRR